MAPNYGLDDFYEQDEEGEEVSSLVAHFWRMSVRVYVCKRSIYALLLAWLVASILSVALLSKYRYYRRTQMALLEPRLASIGFRI